MIRAILGTLVCVSFAAASPAFAAETTKEKAQEAARDVSKNARKGARAIKDETCTLVKGKMECAAKKLKHKAQNAGDEIRDTTDDLDSRI